MGTKPLRIFLGNSPWRRKDAFGVRAGSRWPHFEPNGAPYMPFPFFLAHASSLLKENAFDAKAVDGIAEEISEATFIKKIRSFNPSLIVLEVSSASLETDINLLKKLRTIYGREFPIVWCGAHSWVDESNSVLNQVEDLDFFVQGEYEQTLLEFCQYLQNSNEAWNEIKGLIWRDENGASVENPKRPLENNLENFPWPDRGDFPMQNYKEAAGALEWPTLQMWASRGCPFRCNFCVWPQFMYDGRNYRTRSPKSLLDEVEDSVKRFNMKSVYFDDDTFNIGKKRINDIADEFKKRNLGIYWGAMSRADTFDRPTFENMVESGFRFIKFGVESGDQKIVDRMEKALDLNKVQESMKWAKELNVKTHLTFSFGHIGETFESAQKTIDFALSLSPDSIQFSLITPFPGSDLYEDLKKSGHLDEKLFSQYDGYSSSVISTEHLSSRDLENLLKEANGKWLRHQLWKSAKTRDLSLLKWGVTNPLYALKKVYHLLRY